MPRVELPIEGMTCDHCVAAVERALAAVPGVRSAEVSLSQRRATLDLNEPGPTHVQLAAAVAAVGYRVPDRAPQPAVVQIAVPPPLAASGDLKSLSQNRRGLSQFCGVRGAKWDGPPPRGGSEIGSTAAEPATEKFLLDIEGMHCASCVSRVEQALATVPGVRAARANLATDQAWVEVEARRVNVNELTAAVHRIGYRATPAAPGTASTSEAFARVVRNLARWRRRLAAGLLLLLPIILAHRLISDHRAAAWAQVVPATLIQLYLGWPYLLGAWQRLRHGAANMDTLIAIGTSAAYAGGVVGLVGGQHGMYFMDGGMILVFITLGKYLELRAKRRASSAIQSLVELAPPLATVVDGEQLRTVPAEQVEVGTIILVRPGDRVPLDCTVISGQSAVDQSWLTGESLPVEKGPGDELLAGTINGQGSLQARVARPAGQTALARVVQLVRRAQESKATVERLADRVVSWFVPAVLLLAAGTLTAWGAWLGDWSSALSATVAVLVVACPCALGLATPTAILVAGGRGARLGILVKEAHALEVAARLTTVVLDKTGTVTLGRPQVVRLLSAEGVSSEWLLTVAAAGEQHSGHPLAKPVVEAAHERGLSIPPADQLQVVPGQGVIASVSGKNVLVGSEKLLAGHGLADLVDTTQMGKVRAAGQTPLLVAHSGQLLGVVALADVVAPDARAAIEQLREQGLRVVMVTGDHVTTARAVAAQVGIEEFRAELLPEDKQKIVAELRAAGQVVAMVGDGINDAPALTSADLGVAIGSGADVAIESADVVLMRSSLCSVPQLVALGRATLRTIRQNLAWALAYNVLLLPLAAIAFVPPWAAAAAMATSSVSVVINSLLLARRRLA